MGSADRVKCETDTKEDTELEELALKAKAGERSARNALFLRLGARIRRWTSRARRLTRLSGYLTTEDVDQQAFIIFCGLLMGWEPERTPFLPYLASTMPWQALHYVRGALHYRSKNRAVALEEAECTAQSEIKAEAQQGEEVWRALWGRSAWQLRSEWQQTVSLRFCQGFTSSQIAAFSGRSRRAVDRELHAAVSALRRDIQEGWEDHSTGLRARG
ncbi:MAG: hypothetical protein IVW55_12500 [Chloroflexi bacterium]|nr:hypothetical protein [Chloroflexota bacterium]